MICQERSLTVSSSWDGLPAADDEVVQVSLRPTAGSLQIEVDAPYHDDPPPPIGPGSMDGLWEFEVVEVFIAEVTSGARLLRYTEIELSPHGHFLVLRFEGVRKRHQTLSALDFEATISGDRWQGLARVPWEVLPPPPLQGNAFALHGRGSRRRFLVHSPLPPHLRGDKPDFHRPEAFVSLG